MDTPKLVAFCSNGPRAGKSTCADVLVNEYGYERVKFAGVLKNMTWEFLRLFYPIGTTTTDVFETELKDLPIPGLDGVTTPRQVLITLGTNWGRQYVASDVWCIAASKVIDRLLASGVKVVIDDMRFPNERNMVKRVGGVTVFVHRPGVGQVSVTEGLIEPEKCHRWIANETTVENLQWAVRAMLEHPEDFHVPF